MIFTFLFVSSIVGVILLMGAGVLRFSICVKEVKDDTSVVLLVTIEPLYFSVNKKRIFY